MGKWGTTGLGTRPAWSDSKGKIQSERSDFIAPAGWKWDILDDELGWKLKPELSVAIEPDEGLSEWQQDAFEWQSRRTFQNWPDQMAKSTWFDSVINSTCKSLGGILICYFLTVCFSIHAHTHDAHRKGMRSSPMARMSK